MHGYLALPMALLLASTGVPDTGLSRSMMTLDRKTPWLPAAPVPIAFKTFHPQGMVKIGDDYYVSSVEILALPKKMAAPHDGQSYDAGAGIGHLFKIDAKGRLLADIVLGEGSIYHPGGIDYDGTALWVPVAEYRPHSKSIVYRVDPGTMHVTPVLRVDDHIGAVVHDVADHTLRGMTWGARAFYTWPLDGPGGSVVAAPSHPTIVANPVQYIDYQDCHYVPDDRMLCAGVADYADEPDKPFVLGGIDLVDLKRNLPVWQVPIELRSPTGRPMTQNPFFMERTRTGVRAYFMPDDDRSTIFVFDASIP